MCMLLVKYFKMVFSQRTGRKHNFRYENGIYRCRTMLYTRWKVVGGNKMTCHILLSKNIEIATGFWNYL